MALSILCLNAIINTVSSVPQADGPHISNIEHLPQPTAFRSSSQTDITLNVTINHNKTDLQQNISYQDVEYLIDKSGEEYLDTLLVDKNIQHELESDVVHEDTKLIVDVHIVLYSDVMNEGKYERDVDERNIDINDLRSKIQYDSDMKYGKNRIHIQLNQHETTTKPHPISTAANALHANRRHNASYLWYFVCGSWIIILILICCIAVVYFGCFYDAKSSQSAVADEGKHEALDLVIAPSEGEDTCTVNKDDVREILVVNIKEHEEERMLPRYQTQSYEMSDSEKLYEVHNDHMETQGIVTRTKSVLND